MATYLEPTLPWQKQSRTRILLAVVFVVMTAMAIALGVSFSSSDKPPSNTASTTIQTASIFPSNEPTFGPSPTPTTAQSSFPSNLPSVLPTNAPSSSLAPSSSPTECAIKISSQAQVIDLHVIDPSSPSVAVDRTNMVVSVKDSRLSIFSTIFYSLTNGKWIIVDTFDEPVLEGHHQPSGAVLSGKTAFVGINGNVVVYEQDHLENWKKTQDIPIHGDAKVGFRWGDINGVLACVNDHNSMYLLRRDGIEWVQFDMIDGASRCSIEGDAIAIRGSNLNGFYSQIYRYDEAIDAAVPLQDAFFANVLSVALSRDYLVWRGGEGFGSTFIYQRANETFNFLQKLNIPENGNFRLALDEDILVIDGGGDEGESTYIFSEQNGIWKEIITLDQSYYDYKISGRNLVATDLVYPNDNEVYYFNIEDCVQPMPTQMPSFSAAPTTCYSIKIAIIYNNCYSTHTSWDLQTIGADGILTEIKSYKENDENASLHTEFMCLQEGEYELTIDTYPCLAGGNGVEHYNVTTSSGVLIAEGGEFLFSETIKFSLPFIASPSLAPSSLLTSQASS